MLSKHKQSEDKGAQQTIGKRYFRIPQVANCIESIQFGIVGRNQTNTRFCWLWKQAIIHLAVCHACFHVSML